VLVAVVAFAFVFLVVLLLLIVVCLIRPEHFKISAAVLKFITFSIEIRRPRPRD